MPVDNNVQTKSARGFCIYRFVLLHSWNLLQILFFKQTHSFLYCYEADKLVKREKSLWAAVQGENL